MDWLLGHRQTKEAATDNAEPKATAPHLDSTDSRLSRNRSSDHLSDRSRRKLPVSYYDCGRQETTQ
jgi:hypothetical protein